MKEDKEFENRITVDKMEFVQLTDDEKEVDYRERNKDYYTRIKELINKAKQESPDGEEGIEEDNKTNKDENSSLIR